MGEIPQVRKIRLLGSGASGDVCEAEIAWPSHTHPKGIYAVKELALHKCPESKQSQLPKLTALSCQHIIRYFGNYRISDSSDLVPKIQIITEYCSGVNLKEYLKRHGLCYSLTALYFKQLREALIYLHKKKIIHTDVKCANIFLADLDITGLYRSVKLGDVDDPIFKRDWKTLTEDIPALRGTIPYISPEMTRKVLENSGKVGSATDWWSLGCVLYEMAVGYETFVFENPMTKQRMTTEHGNPFQTLKFIQDGGRLVLPTCCQHLKKAFETCFYENPEERSNGMLRTELFGNIHDLFTVPTPVLIGCCENAGSLYDDSAVKNNNSAFYNREFVHFENSISTAADNYQATLGFPSSVTRIWRNRIEIYVQPNNELRHCSTDGVQDFVDFLEQLKCAHIRGRMQVDIRLDYLRAGPSAISPDSPLNHLTMLSDVITHINLYNKHSPSYEYIFSRLNRLSLPNLVHLAFLETENIFVEANTFQKFPMLKILSFIDCSFVDLANNFLAGIKRLERFVLKRRTLSQLTEFPRVCKQENGYPFVMSWEVWTAKIGRRYDWLLDFLSHNGDLISPKPIYTHVENGIYQTENWPEDWNMEEYGLDIVTKALAFGQMKSFSWYDFVE